jgi:hypothetical protein
MNDIGYTAINWVLALFWLAVIVAVLYVVFSLIRKVVK